MREIITGQDERVGKWIAERTDGEWRPGQKCIGLERNGKLIAGSMYDWFNGSSIYMHVAGEGNWADYNFLWFSFYYPFEQLKAKVIIGLVPQSNLKARKFDEHLGFKLHSRIPDGHPDGDLLIYIMRREDCRWLLREARHAS